MKRNRKAELDELDALDPAGVLDDTCEDCGDVLDDDGLLDAELGDDDDILAYDKDLVLGAAEDDEDDEEAEDVTEASDDDDADDVDGDSDPEEDDDDVTEAADECVAPTEVKSASRRSTASRLREASARLDRLASYLEKHGQKKLAFRLDQYADQIDAELKRIRR